MLLKILQLHTVSLSVDCWVENPQGLFKNPSQPKKPPTTTLFIRYSKIVVACAIMRLFTHILKDIRSGNHPLNC